MNESAVSRASTTLLPRAVYAAAGERPPAFVKSWSAWTAGRSGCKLSRTRDNIKAGRGNRREVQHLGRTRCPRILLRGHGFGCPCARLHAQGWNLCPSARTQSRGHRVVDAQQVVDVVASEGRDVEQRTARRERPRSAELVSSSGLRAIASMSLDREDFGRVSGLRRRSRHSAEAWRR